MALPLAEKPALTSLLSTWWPLAPRFLAKLQLLFPAPLLYGEVSAVRMSGEPRLSNWQPTLTSIFRAAKLVLQVFLR